MKFLKAIGWVFVPYIMLPFQWKKIGTAGKTIGSIWAILVLIAGFSNVGKEQPQEAAPPVQQSAPAPQTQPVDAPKPQSSSTPAPVPKTVEQTPEQAPKPAAQPVSAPVETNDPAISKAEFDKIKNGMSYKEVVKIIGSEGEMLSEVGSAGEQFHTVVYMWEGEGSLGANANFTFQEDKLQMKAQMGLK